MNRLILISKYFVKSSLSGMFKGGKSNAIRTAILMALLILIMSAPFGFMVIALYDPLKQLNQEGMLLSTIYLAGTAIIFFFGIFTILNVFYFSDDIQDFLPMPFKSGEIIFGKFLAAFIDMVLYSIVLIIPLIIFGICSGGGVLYYLYMIISLILITVTPLVLASIVCLLVMRVVPLTKHKDAVRVVTGCLALVLAVVFNVFIQGNSNSNTSDTDYIVQLISKGDNSVMQAINGFLVINKFSANALLNSGSIQGLLNIIVAIIIGIGLFAVYYILGSKLYLKSVIGMSETYSKRQNIFESNKSKDISKVNSPRKALILKDIKTIFRTPQFFINCVAMLIYMPAIFGVIFMSNGAIDKLKDMISQGSQWYGLVIAIVFLGTSLFISNGGAATTCLSREGKDFKVSRYIPIDYNIQLQSKLISVLIINSFSIVIMAILLAILNVSRIVFILGLIVSASTIILVSLFGMYFDFKSPNLEWEDEKEMFKKNYMPVITLFIMLIVGGIYIGVSFLIKNYFLIFVIIIAINIIASIVFYSKIKKLAEEIYSN